MRLSDRFHVLEREGTLTLRARTDGVLVAYLGAVLAVFGCSVWAAAAPGAGSMIAMVFASCILLATGLLHRQDSRRLHGEPGRVRRSLSARGRAEAEGYRREVAAAELTVDGRSLGAEQVRRVVVGEYAGLDVNVFTTCIVTDTRVIRVEEFREGQRAAALGEALRDALGLTGEIEVVEEGGGTGCLAAVAFLFFLLVEVLAYIFIIVAWLVQAQWKAQEHSGSGSQVSLWAVALGTGAAIVAVNLVLQGVVMRLLRPGPRRGALTDGGTTRS